MQIYIVSVNGVAQDKVFTTVKGFCDFWKELPYSTMRKAFKESNVKERIYVAGQTLYRVSVAEVMKVKGRGGKNNLPSMR